MNSNSISPHPLDNVATGDSNYGTVLKMQTGLVELGRNRAVASGTLEAIAEELRALEEHAQSMARDTYRDAFDPALHHQDAMHKAEYDRDIAEREEAKKGAAHATANLRDAEGVFGNTPRAGEKPTVNPKGVAAFVIAILISCAPTLHDAFFHAMDDMLAWFIAFVISGFVAYMMVFAILNGRHTSWAWLGVGAGILVGIGLGALRLASASGALEVMLAVGMTIFEIGSVILLEVYARSLKNREDRWDAIRVIEDKAVNSLAAAQKDLSRWNTSISTLDARINGRIAMVEDRHNRNIHLPELEAVAVKAVRDGYFAGIAENVGRIRGARRT